MPNINDKITHPRITENSTFLSVISSLSFISAALILYGITTLENHDSNTPKIFLAALMLLISICVFITIASTLESHRSWNLFSASRHMDSTTDTCQNRLVQIV